MSSNSSDLRDRLKFTGSWRPYQAEALNELKHYLKDGKVHIVAAPGAGKTVLGIELLRQLNQHSVILTPRVSIQMQWAASIKNLFHASVDEPALVSVDVANPAPITILTYQSLRQLLSKKKEAATLLEGLMAFKPRTLVLDEAHHLTESWAVEVQQLYEQLGANRTISLTATPPFELKGKQWQSYENLCGEFDLEISIPELVSHADLCPHQDYVYLNTPTADESKKLSAMRERQDRFFEWLVTEQAHDELLSGYVQSLLGDWSAPRFSDPNFRLGIAAFAKYKGHDLSWIDESCPPLHGVSIPEFSLKWLQAYLTGVLRERHAAGTRSAKAGPKTLQVLRKRLEDDGFLGDQVVELVTPPEAKRLLSLSGNKVHSIANIAAAEFDSLGDQLRLLVLVDRIGDDSLSEEAPPPSPVEASALPAFLHLRSSFEGADLEMALLTGRLIIVPKTLIAELENFFADHKKSFPSAKFLPLAAFPNLVYVQGSASYFPDLIAGCTMLLDTGRLQLVVGTGSLLGEGWDCPGVNSLILASQIGSFVSSNQMRGRAIRIDTKSEGKVANIWHLGTVQPGEISTGHDLGVLQRRFKTFVGVARDEDTITDGIDRMGLPDSQIQDIGGYNSATLALAANRAELSESWQAVLQKAKYGRLNFRIQSDRLPGKKRLVLANALLAEGWVRKIFNPISLGIDLCRMNVNALLIQRLCKQIVQALYRNDFIQTRPFRIGFRASRDGEVIVSCKDRKDNAVIAAAIAELFSVSEDTRYLLCFKFPLASPIYFGVPGILGRKKEIAESTQQRLAKVMGKTELIYAKGPEGQKIAARLISEQLAGPTKRAVESSRIWS